MLAKMTHKLHAVAEKKRRNKILRTQGRGARDAHVAAYKAQSSARGQKGLATRNTKAGGTHKVTLPNGKVGHRVNGTKITYANKTSAVNRSQGRALRLDLKAKRKAAG